jgi:ubiquinone biosynthesis protein COQ4
MISTSSTMGPAAHDVPPPTIAPPPVRPKVQWRRAWRAMRTLIADPDRTDQAFEAIAALSGADWERLFQRFATHRDGRALLAERPSLLATLSDLPRLRAMPAGTFGRAYADFMIAGEITAVGLVEAERVSIAVQQLETLDPDREWFADRLRDVHDLWHVLTGYGRDEAGEAANLAFTFGQTPLRGIALILFGIALQPPADGYGRRTWYRYLYRAWQRGRHATRLPLVRYEDLLPRPLDEVRRALAIAPASTVHPEGVIVANGPGREGRGVVAQRDRDDAAMPRIAVAADEIP